MLGSGFLPMFAAGGAPLVLTGATWALDGNGRAYCVPTLGSELLTNGNFASWSGDNPVGWTIGVENATNFVTESPAGQARIVTDSFWGISQNVLSTGNWYEYSIDVKARVLNTVRVDNSNTGVAGYTTTGLKRGALSATGASFGIFRGVSGTGDFTVDDISVKQIAIASTIASISGATGQGVAGKIFAMPSFSHGGVVSHLDNASTLGNYLHGYLEQLQFSTNARLDKVVAGVRTNLISVSASFSAGAQIEIRRQIGNVFQLWYGGSQRGPDQAISDAGIINNTLYGLFSTYSGNLFTEFSLDGAVIPFGF